MVRARARKMGLWLFGGIATLIVAVDDAHAQAPPPPAPGPAGYPQQPAPAPQPYAYPPSYYAPPIVVAPAPPPKENSVNASPLGMFWGNYSLNYERLVSGTHGFMIEGSFAHYTGTSLSSGESSSSKSTNYGGGIGYRWHWSRQQNSGFLGLMAGYSVGSGESTITSSGMTNTFDLTIKAPWVVANIGKRWQWDSGLNITFRVGAGWAKYTVSSNSTDPQAQEAVQFVQDILTLIPIALDGELSVGYSF